MKESSHLCLRKTGKREKNKNMPELSEQIKSYSDPSH